MTNNTPDYKDNLYFPQLKEGKNSFKATFDNHFSLKKTEGLDFSELLQNSENVANNVANKKLQHLTNYDILKEYEAHQTPVPSYDELKQLKEYERIVKSYYGKPIDYDIACETVNKLLDEKKNLKEQNAQLKDVLKTIKHQCELLLPKNGLAPVGDRERLCRTFFDLIDEVLK